ncbi:MAG: S8 family serine peptidase, partial [Flavobacteriales bacterium]|nr:S8 family serine peptidase [Flavobacteriales bacterium]
MKNNLTAAFMSLMLFASSTLFAQISPRLQQVMDESPSDTFQNIRVEFVDNVDCYALNHQFKQQRLEVTERPKVVITELQQQANISQNPVIDRLESALQGHYQSLEKFWIVNLLVMKADKEAIEVIENMTGVALIDIEDQKILPHDPIIRGEETADRAPNGIEPGLEAINAPAMWALGYTGRGRLVYDYDTGVWPTHPAFADRFLAHRFPMSQSWLGFFSSTPNGNISDHGTHTLGTIAGLVEATNDTIGVAYKTYWIANDFVTSTVEALPPITDMIAAFEWALNPDDDINTTNDIPDVINNSWRWLDDPDTAQCAGFVVNLMNAIEAAGIANVFSGGNSGPGNSTVNAPQRINTSEVNTFSVGSVDGNQSFPYPISNFSTRGPKQCPHNGSISLEIHPEVVAPGQNVRSAWDVDDFNTISGTSMAAPHVSGAILLLKEAFPGLSGEDLLRALYITAVDMGDVGEDNTYGKGIIDVFAAFQHLSQSNVPVDPNEVKWDLAITSATSPAESEITCENSFSTSVVIKNLGDSTITSVEFEYNINGAGTQNYSWSGSLPSGNTQVIDLPTISTNLYGSLDLNILTSINGHPNEYDLFNNRWRIPFDRRDIKDLPFTEEFEYGFESNNWLVINEDGAASWESMETGGLQWNGESATVQCYTYSPRQSQKDNLLTPRLTIPTSSEPKWLLFDLAYQMRTSNGIGHDSLQIHVSTDCAETFSHIIYNKAGEELNTRDTTELNFIPQFEWDWRRDSVDISSFSGEDIIFNFQTTNRRGNNIYIDNIKVFEGNVE